MSRASHRANERGSIFAETVCAVALIGIAVMIAASLLASHPRAAARLEAQTEVLRVLEATLESARAGAIPLVSGTVRPTPIRTRKAMTVVLRVREVGPPGLFEVTASARCPVHGTEVQRHLSTMMWRPR
jgi:type II secretory pathway pseudopilin PulG